MLIIREWKLKIKGLWIKEGDKNIKFFQYYSIHKNNYNTICYLVDEEGNKFNGLKDLANLAINFRQLFKETLLGR
jgi:hypothetical protein